MKVDLGIWGKLTRVVVFLLFLAVTLGIAQRFVPVIKKNERMRKKIIELDTQIQKNEEAAKQSKVAIDSLRYDSKAVERLARERLGYARPDEVVVRFDKPATNQVVAQ